MQYGVWASATTIWTAITDRLGYTKKKHNDMAAKQDHDGRSDWIRVRYRCVYVYDLCIVRYLRM